MLQKIQPSLYFPYKGTVSEYKRLASLNLSGTESGEPCTRSLAVEHLDYSYI